MLDLYPYSWLPSRSLHVSSLRLIRAKLTSVSPTPLPLHPTWTLEINPTASSSSSHLDFVSIRWERDQQHLIQQPAESQKRQRSFVPACCKCRSRLKTPRKEKLSQNLTITKKFRLDTSRLSITTLACSLVVFVVLQARTLLVFWRACKWCDMRVLFVLVVLVVQLGAVLAARHAMTST